MGILITGTSSSLPPLLLCRSSATRHHREWQHESMGRARKGWKRLLDLDAWQQGLDPNAKSAGNAQWFQLPATAPHHREVVSRGGHQAFVRTSDGCADAEASLAGPYPADACRPPIAPCGVGAGPMSWTAVPTWQPPDGHALPPTQTSPASSRPPRTGTRWPIPLLPTGKPLRSETPQIVIKL